MSRRADEPFPALSYELELKASGWKELVGSSLLARRLLAVRDCVGRQVEQAVLRIELQGDIALRVCREDHLDAMYGFARDAFVVFRDGDVNRVGPNDRTRHRPGVRAPRQVERDCLGRITRRLV